MWQMIQFPTNPCLPTNTSRTICSLCPERRPASLDKRILKDSLPGIAALHEKGIVHTNIKANTIMMDWDETDGNTTVCQLQIADIEDAACVPGYCAIVGRQVGNWMWRSPEANASGRVHKPLDIFSFGVVVGFVGPEIRPLLTCWNTVHLCPDETRHSRRHRPRTVRTSWPSFLNDNCPISRF